MTRSLQGSVRKGTAGDEGGVPGYQHSIQEKSKRFPSITVALSFDENRLEIS